MGKYAKLIMITENNNNKFYEMTENNGSIDVKYGRVDSSSVSVTYSIGEWDRLINSKKKKGYVEVSDLISVEVKDDTGAPTVYDKIQDSLVEKFITLMRNYTNNLVTKTYSVKSTSVTQKQVDTAQDILDKLVKLDPKKDSIKINETLISLYTCIPRFMGNVRNHLLPAIENTYAQVVQQEQDNLDSMASQVKLDTKKSKTKSKKSDVKKSKTFLDDLGISMKECKPTAELDYLLKQVKATQYKLAGLFECNKPAEDENIQSWMKTKKNKETRILIHGTRCTSVIPILETSLQIRPAGNFAFSGKAFGEAIYFANECQKSLGYTGYDKDKVLLIYEVHYGNTYLHQGRNNGTSFTYNLTELEKRGYDSVHATKGNGLIRDEIMVYNEKQFRIKYILWLT